MQCSNHFEKWICKHLLADSGQLADWNGRLESFKITIFKKKLDQSSKIRNFNMQLYRNCAPNAAANTKFYPRRPKKNKSNFVKVVIKIYGYEWKGIKLANIGHYVALWFAYGGWLSSSPISSDTGPRKTPPGPAAGAAPLPRGAQQPSCRAAQR